MTNTVGHQLAYDQPDVFKLLSGKSPSSRSREWRAAMTASESGMSLRSIRVTDSRVE